MTYKSTQQTMICFPPLCQPLLHSILPCSPQNVNRDALIYFQCFYFKILIIKTHITDIENKLMITKGEKEGRDKLGIGD